MAVGGNEASKNCKRDHTHVEKERAAGKVEDDPLLTVEAALQEFVKMARNESNSFLQWGQNATGEFDASTCNGKLMFV